MKHSKVSKQHVCFYCDGRFMCEKKPRSRSLVDGEFKLVGLSHLIRSFVVGGQEIVPPLWRAIKYTF